MSDCSEPKKNNSYDVAVIGAGSAGFSAAITAADEGAQVALIGHGTIGGTCVNFGCVPSKALIRATETLHVAHSANRFRGIEASAKLTDWKALVAQKQELVDGLRKAKYSDLLPAYNSVAYMEGKASFGQKGKLLVDGKELSARKIIIATGTRPAVPSINGIEDVPYLTSTTALQLEALPESLLVIGAGYISAEIAQMFARAGVKVTIVSRRGLLPESEPEISEALTRYFKDEGITIISGVAYERIESQGNTIRLHVLVGGKPTTITAEQLLVATGRTANTESLNLDLAGIATNTNNSIKVDPQMRTTRDGVYAAGDVTGRDQFVYMAAYGAKIAAKNAMNGNALSYDNSIMPVVVFSDPQVASVGLTEAQARSQGIQVRTSVLTLDNVPRAIAARDTRGLIKLVVESKTGRLIGAHILAPEGSDSIQTAAMAIKAGMTYQDMASMIFPYLTTVEGLKLAAQTFDKDVKMLSCCAG